MAVSARDDLVREPPALRWGHTLDRRVLGVWLMTGGTMAIAGANTFALLVLLAGTLGHAAGWALLPGPGSRRLAAALVSTPAVWLLISGNAHFIGVLVVPFLGWQLVRQRSAAAWLSGLLPAAAALACGELFGAARAMLPAFALMALSMLPAEAAAIRFDRWGAARSRPRRTPRISRRNPSGAP